MTEASSYFRGRGFSQSPLGQEAPPPPYPPPEPQLPSYAAGERKEGGSAAGAAAYRNLLAGSLEEGETHAAPSLWQARVCSRLSVCLGGAASGNWGSSACGGPWSWALGLEVAEFLALAWEPFPATPSEPG